MAVEHTQGSKGSEAHRMKCTEGKAVHLDLWCGRKVCAAGQQDAEGLFGRRALLKPGRMEQGCFKRGRWIGVGVGVGVGCGGGTGDQQDAKGPIPVLSQRGQPRGDIPAHCLLAMRPLSLSRPPLLRRLLE